jgi:hypothetical protein
MKILTKTQLMEAIELERGKLEKKIAGLSDAEILFPGCMDHWSVKDIMAHLVDWEQRCINWYETGKRGEKPVTPEPGYKWGQLPALNEKYYLLHKDQPLAEVRAQFQASFQQIKGYLAGMPEEELLTPGTYAWTGEHALLGYFKANTSSHYHWAAAQISPKSLRERMMKLLG